MYASERCRFLGRGSLDLAGSAADPKSGEPVFLPIPETLKLALDALPLPRNAAQDCPYFFWNGHTARRAVVGIAERALAAVFRKSGVKNAHAHRFRHTLATRLWVQGATFEQVADILGNSPWFLSTMGSGRSAGRTSSIASCSPISGRTRLHFQSQMSHTKKRRP